MTNSEVKGIALGEGAVIAFWWDESDTKFGAAVWEDGEVASDKKVSYPKEYQVLNPTTHAVLEEWSLRASDKNRLAITAIP